MDELVSVIIPIYNVEQYLERCLDSVVNQTYKNLEIILVDDGSTDQSATICARWADKDSRIALYRQENSGVSAARNLGLDHAAGQFITFVDADDYLKPTHVEKMMEMQAKSSTGGGGQTSSSSVPLIFMKMERQSFGKRRRGTAC